MLQIAGRAFVGLTVGHLFQVVEIHLWLSLFKTSASYEKLMVQRLHTLDHSVEHSDDDKNRAVHRPVSGITRVERTCFYLLLLLPRRGTSPTRDPSERSER